MNKNFDKIQELLHQKADYQARINLKRGAAQKFILLQLQFFSVFGAALARQPLLFCAKCGRLAALILFFQVYKGISSCCRFLS